MLYEAYGREMQRGGQRGNGSSGYALRTDSCADSGSTGQVRRRRTPRASARLGGVRRSEGGANRATGFRHVAVILRHGLLRWRGDDGVWPVCVEAAERCIGTRRRTAWKSPG